LKRLNIENFCGLQWRPRLPTLLSVKQQQEIRKNLKKYSAQFESKDRMRQSRASKVSFICGVHVHKHTHTHYITLHYLT